METICYVAWSQRLCLRACLPQAGVGCTAQAYPWAHAFHMAGSSRQDDTSLRKLVVGRLDMMVASERMLQDLCQRIQVRCAQLGRLMPLPGLRDYAKYGVALK